MEKQFIPYELALKLKELGFDELCFGWWSHINGNTASFYSYNCNNTELVDLNTFSKNCTAPLWQQAFDWFREKGKIIQSDLFDSYDRGDGYEEEGYYFKISDYDGWRGGLRDTYKGESYRTLEQTKTACLEKLIEITENEKTNKN